MGLVKDAPHSDLTYKAVGLAMTVHNVALLINFGRRRLEWKRLFPPKKISEHRRKKWGKRLA